MKYVKLVFAVEEAYQELMIAELSYLGFDGFQQLGNELITYIPQKKYAIDGRKRVEQMMARSLGSSYIKTEEVVMAENWNRKWEQTIKAQIIGSFLVKPTWGTAKPEADQLLVQIDPNMAFGTGYHETTRLMLRPLPEIIKKGHKVLDAGTGTGILAIAAAKLGADRVLAFDIDALSIENAQKNVIINNVENKIIIKEDSVEVVNECKIFDVILVNIQKNVIIEIIPFLKDHLKKGGDILLSGLLRVDEEEIRACLAANGMSHLKTDQENEWIAVWARN